MKISFSTYFLTPKKRLNAISYGAKREGVLLKVEWEDGLIGFADLHPWTELGDLSVADQLKGLRQGHSTIQGQQSLKFARRDAEFRQKNLNAFDQFETKVVKNNFLFSNNIDSANSNLGSEISLDVFFENLKRVGFSTVKIKTGINLENEKYILEKAAHAGLRIRLDFNAVLNFPDFMNFMSELPESVMPQIEYVEDPFPFNAKTWAEAKKIVKLAVDNQFDKVHWDALATVPFDVLVIKPAKVDVENAMALCHKFNLKATVTSYMDHALGISHSAYEAMRLKEKYGELILESGCLTHHAYDPDSFSAELHTDGPYFYKVNGTGFGFDALLEEASWTPL
ncbi:MAG: o-succinylbenzoate synthase MenC [Bdellovibrio sp.]